MAQASCQLSLLDEHANQACTESVHAQQGDQASSLSRALEARLRIVLTTTHRSKVFVKPALYRMQ